MSSFNQAKSSVVRAIRYVLRYILMCVCLKEGGKGVGTTSVHCPYRVEAKCSPISGPVPTD